MGTIECPQCGARITPEEVSAGVSLVCPDCDDMDPEQAAAELAEEEEEGARAERPAPFTRR